MPPPRNIAAFIESSRSYGRSLIRGIADFATGEDWQLLFQESALSHSVPDWVKDPDISGILARISSRAMADSLAGLNVPVVDLLGEFPHPEIPRVVCDNHAIAAAAFEFFASAGFGNFAYCGYNGIHYSDVRRTSFAAAAAGKNITVDVYQSGSSGTDIARREARRIGRTNRLRQWLDGLEKPVAIFCANDTRALDVSAACRACDIAVPQDVAILGVDDDPLFCELASPPNSSVKPDTRLQGRRAAEFLKSMIEGTGTPPAETLISPLPITERTSTDVVISDLPHIAAALRFIRRHLAESISRDDIAAYAGVSPSLLDRDFKCRLGRTSAEELRLLRLNRVRQILTTTDLSLDEIARQTGFSNKVSLSHFFKTHTGISPGTLRKTRK
ncbi:MAG: DNA-binding transcriptional regulator [Verrucomicrobiota bacterium]